MDAPAKHRAWRQWILGAVGLLMGVAAASLAVHHRAPAPSPQIHSDAPAVLYVQHDGSALRLHWDPAVHADSGIIWIQDGARETRLDLNANELRSGVASYWPESHEVTFRLQLDGGPAATIRASADAPPPPAPAVVSEKPPRKRSGPKAMRVAAREAADAGEVPPSKRSRLSRVAGKIPLVRRLRKH